MRGKRKTAVVVGAGSVLAATAASALTAAGMSVVRVCASGAGDCGSTAGGADRAIDPADQPGLAAAIAGIDGGRGIDVLVICPMSSGVDGSFHDPDAPARFAAAVEADLLGAINCMRVATAGMCARQTPEEGDRGTIVIVSLAGDGPSDEIGPLASSLVAARSGMINPATHEFADSGIRFAAIEVARSAAIEAHFGSLLRQVVENPGLGGTVLSLAREEARVR